MKQDNAKYREIPRNELECDKKYLKAVELHSNLHCLR